MGLKTSSNQWFKNIISPTGRPPFEWLYIYILCALVGYSIADLNILTFRPQMLPKKAPPLKPKRMMRQKLISSSDLRKITDRNIFNNDGLIPPPLTDGEKKGENLDGPPVLSKLPLKLLGTIVHLDPNKSIATINKSSGNESESFRVGERIESLAEITKIERRKVIFRNLATRRLEYIEIPEDNQINFGLKAPRAKPTTITGDEVKKEGEFRFRISKDDLEKYTSDLSSILKQARMVPNIVPGSGGTIDGFRFVSIQPDSIFSKLGFQPGDVIKGVNNEPVTSPTQAMEMYQSLKSSDHLTLSVNREGREEVFDYNID